MTPKGTTNAALRPSIVIVLLPNPHTTPLRAVAHNAAASYYHLNKHHLNGHNSGSDASNRCSPRMRILVYRV